jgi:hypothetical protein
MCIVYTGQIHSEPRQSDPSKRHALKTEGLRIDTQTGGIGLTFAPLWWMVKGHKYRGMSDQEYIDAYYDLMRKRYLEDPEPFISLLKREEVTLLCWCRPGKFCHRLLLVDILEKIAKQRHMPFTRGGEHGFPVQASNIG